MALASRAMTDLSVTPVTADPDLDGDHERMAHIVLEGWRPEEGDFIPAGPSVVEGIVNSTPVKALCGKVWVPSQIRSDTRSALPARRSPSRTGGRSRAPEPGDSGTVTTIADWFTARLPADWDARGVEVFADPDEVLVVVDLGDRTVTGLEGRMFREESRDQRVAIATAAQAEFGLKVSWAARGCGEVIVFTSASVPVMTRLRLGERMTLDTLIDAGVARTRSEALAWCVRLVGEHEAEWIADLRSAFKAVEEVRERGPVRRRKQ